MSTVPKPLPCPFCGGSPDVVVHPGAVTGIWCANPECIVTVRLGATTEAEAIAAWNRRAPCAHSGPIVAELGSSYD